MSRVLVVAEHDGARLDSEHREMRALRARSAARRARGRGVRAATARASPRRPRGSPASPRSLLVDAPHNAAPLAAVLAPQIASLAGGLHARARPVVDVRQGLAAARGGVARRRPDQRRAGVLDAHRFRRPIYAGNAIVTVDAPIRTRIVVATVRLASYAGAGSRGAPAPVDARALDVAVPSHTRFVELRPAAGTSAGSA